MDWLVLWTLLHAFRRSTFSLLLAQKFQQAKTCFPTPSTKVFPVSPPYLPISFMLFRVCLSCYFVLSIPLDENAYVIICYLEKLVEKLSRT